MSYMLDTNICIYYMKKKCPAIMEKIKQHFIENRICISAITLAELEYGVAKSRAVEKNMDALYRFLSVINIIPFGDEASFCYGKIRASLERSGTPIGPLDMLIAAHALASDRILVTNNVKEFKRVANLRIENWVSTN